MCFVLRVNVDRSGCQSSSRIGSANAEICKKEKGVERMKNDEIKERGTER